MMETLVSIRGEVSRSEKPRKSDIISKDEVSWTRISQGSPERRPFGIEGASSTRQWGHEE